MARKSKKLPTSTGLSILKNTCKQISEPIPTRDVFTGAFGRHAPQYSQKCKKVGQMSSILEETWHSISVTFLSVTVAVENYGNQSTRR